MSMMFAYSDPGSGSLLIQAILGGAAGLVVFAKYLWDAASRKPQNRDVGMVAPLATSAGSSGEIPQYLLP